MKIRRNRIGDVQNVPIGNKVVPVGEVYEKTLYATKPIKVMRNPDSATVVRTIGAGSPVGVVYSVLERNGVLWWVLYPTSEEKAKFGQYVSPTVRHTADSFSLTKLQQQGTQTSEDKIKQEQQQQNPILFAISDTIKSLFMPVAIGAGAYFIIKALTEPRQKKGKK